MVNIRVDKKLVDMFDKVAELHSRDRTKELKYLMIESVRKEFPDFVPPASE